MPRDPGKRQLSGWVDADLLDRFQARAKERGETATKALIRFMEWYVGDRRKP